MAKYKPRAGVGAKARILTKMIYPRRTASDPKAETNVVLVAEEEKTINKKKQPCITFTVEGEDGLCYAIKRYVHVYEEGDTVFDPSLPGPKEKKEKLPKWRKSKAKKLLYEFLMDGTIPMTDDGTLSIEEIHSLDHEIAKYDIEKLKGRLNRVRAKIRELNSRAVEDLEAFRLYKQLHQPSLFSHKGYIQWQGSTAQELLWDDLPQYLKDPDVKPKDLWMSRKEYHDEFPLDAFRDKIKQEIRTQKYIKTIQARANGEKT
jgi:hypothetical protein